MTLLAALLLSLGLANDAATSADPPTRVARGTIASFEVSHPAGPLRAKAVRDGGSPILVRVNPIGGDRHRVECFAVVEGTFDLVPFLEQSDGRPPIGLSALEGGYRRWLAIAAIAWLAVPVVVIVRRRLRRPEPMPPEEPVASPEAIDRLSSLLEDAKRTTLDVEQQARLELLLLKALREAAGGRAGLAESIAWLRRDPANGPVVLEVERWLHARNGEAREADAIAKVERFATPSPTREDAAS
ncbi:MAG: hypothetical protein ACO3ZY_01055 [Phycisphaerales bacterium]